MSVRHILIVATLLLSTSAAAQTALIDTPPFQLNDDGSLVSMGAIGTGVIPATGAGARLMWHPAKAAFRAGFVNGTHWDEANIGAYSVAMGRSTTASGTESTAMGQDTQASGMASTAMGTSTEASGSHSTAMGFLTMASGLHSTAMGESTTAQARGSLVIGRYNIIAGNSTSWVAGDPALVVGNGSSTVSRSNALTLLKSGNLLIAGILFQNSDRRLKTDIRPLSEAVSGLARLQPVRFRFRAGTNRPEGVHIGLIAQEVQAVFPELVSEGADGYLSVSYANLSAVLVQALNEQQAEIEAQQAENEARQNEIEALHDRLARLEALLARAGAENPTER